MKSRYRCDRRGRGLQAMVQCLAIALTFVSSTFALGQSREEKLRIDRRKFESLGVWHYHDLESAFEKASSTKQPLMVVLRCIPCEECVKLDDEIIESDSTLQTLLNSFVRVRVVGTNGLDLSIFEYDTDQSFAVFFFNADRTLYGRYGTRSDRTHWQDDVSVEGLGKAMVKALTLHQNYPKNREALVGKQADKPLFPSPEKFPSLAKKYSSDIDFQGNAVKSCIHCHQIGDAIKEFYRAEQGKVPDQWLFPYPHPKSIGMILDPKECATITQVSDQSPAHSAGFQTGDRILTLSGQPILSIADVQWVLQHVASQGGSIAATVNRNDEIVNVDLKLPAGWRTKDDIAWRASSWSLRQFGLGGMILKPISVEQRRELGIENQAMALQVGHVGAYPPHDRAKNAGVQKGDILIEYDGRRDLLRETDLIAYSINQVEVGKEVPMQFRRGAEVVSIKITTSK